MRIPPQDKHAPNHQKQARLKERRTNVRLQQPVEQVKVREDDVTAQVKQEALLRHVRPRQPPRTFPRVHQQPFLVAVVVQPNCRAQTGGACADDQCGHGFHVGLL